MLGAEVEANLERTKALLKSQTVRPVFKPREIPPAQDSEHAIQPFPRSAEIWRRPGHRGRRRRRRELSPYRITGKVLHSK